MFLTCQEIYARKRVDYYSWGQPETDRRTVKRPKRASRADDPGAFFYEGEIHCLQNLRREASAERLRFR